MGNARLCYARGCPPIGQKSNGKRKDRVSDGLGPAEAGCPIFAFFRYRSEEVTIESSSLIRM